jgi:DNA-binding IclR family transcriptional regulator
MTGPTAARDDRAAVDKAVSLLVALGEHRRHGAGVSELARHTGLSKSTAFRVLRMLERNDIVERIGTDYRLGTRMHQLGRPAYTPEHDVLRDRLLPHLADLYELTHHTVHLGALLGTDVIYLAKLYGHHSMPAPSQIGGRLPAHITAVGKVLLSHDPVAATTVTTRPLRSVTPYTITDPTRLCAELAAVREIGLAFDRQESRLGLGCVAAPISDHRGRVVAAFSISAPYTALAADGPLSTPLRRIAADASRTISRLRIPAADTPASPIGSRHNPGHSGLRGRTTATREEGHERRLTAAQ